MKKFSENIKSQVDKLSDSVLKNESNEIAKLIRELEDSEFHINAKINKIVYLLDLIDNHEIVAKKYDPNEVYITQGDWISTLVSNFEKISIKKIEELLPEEIELIERETGKLKATLLLLKKQQHFIISLIAKSKIHLMEVSNIVCKEETGGDSIVEVAQSLLDNFGKELDYAEYEVGKIAFVNYIKKRYSISRKSAHKVFNLLEHSRVLVFNLEPTYLNIEIPLDTFMQTDVSPMAGKWIIKA